MAERGHLVHGLRVRIEGDCAEPARALLAGFPPATGGPADLTIELNRVGVPASPDEASRPIFFHGTARAVEKAGTIVLHDRGSALAVSPDGARVDGRVHAAALADGGHAFAHVTLLLAFVVALRHRGLFHVHAAALVTPGGTRLLVPGGGGAGKTTLSLALLEQGCSYLGDDAVFLARRAGGLEVLALPRAFHVSERTARAFPATVAHAPVGAPGGKRWIDAEAAHPGRRLHRMAAPDVLIFPVIGEVPRTTAQALSCAEAAGALVESSALVVVDCMPGVREHLDVLRGVADAARSFRAELGLDLLEDPRQAARELLSRVGAR